MVLKAHSGRLCARRRLSFTRSGCTSSTALRSGSLSLTACGQFQA